MKKIDIYLSYLNEKNYETRFQNMYDVLKSYRLNVYSNLNQPNNSEPLDGLKEYIIDSKIFLCCITKSYACCRKCKFELNTAYDHDIPIIIIMFEKMETKDMKGLVLIINQYEKLNAYEGQAYFNMLPSSPFYDGLLKQILSIDNMIFKKYNTNLPEKNKNFIFRERIFKELNRHFDIQKNEFVAIYSIAGSGKSLTAIEYAHILEENDDKLLIWFFNCETNESFDFDFQNFLKLFSMDYIKQNKSSLDFNLLSNILLKLEDKRLFFIFDNVEEKSTFEQFFKSIQEINNYSKKNIIQVLITTRNSTLFQDENQMLKLDLFSYDDAFNFIKIENLNNVQDFERIETLIDLIKDDSNVLLPFKLAKACEYLKSNRLLTLNESSSMIQEYIFSQVKALFLVKSIKNSENIIEFLSYAALINIDCINLKIFCYLQKCSTRKIKNTLKILSQNSFIEVVNIKEKNFEGLRLNIILKNVFLKIIEDNRLDHARYLDKIGTFYSLAGNIKEELEYYSKSLKIKQDLLPEDNPVISVSLNIIGTLFFQDGSEDEGLDFLLQSLKNTQNMITENTFMMSIVCSNIGFVYYRKIQAVKELENSHTYLSILRKNLLNNKISNDYISFATNLISIGIIKKKKNDYGRALLCFEKSLKIFQSIFPEDYPFYSTSLILIGSIHENNGDYNKALEYYENSLIIKINVFPKDYFAISRNLILIAIIHDKLGDYIKALKYFENSLKVFEKKNTEIKTYICKNLDFIECVNYKIGNTNNLLSFLEKSLRIKQKLLPENHPEIATTLSNMAIIHFDLGCNHKAFECIQASIKIFENIFTIVT